MVLVFIGFTTIVSAALLLKNKSQNAPVIQSVTQPFCGTQSDTADDPDAQKGKQIFNSNCAACHKLDAVAMAPALRNVATKYQKKGKGIYNYLQGKRDTLVLRKPNKGSMGLCPVFPNLTKEDVASLEAYMH